MPVNVMLNQMSSYEFTEWRAYEQAFGPLGRGYSDQVLRDVYKQLQILNVLMSQQFEDDTILGKVARQVNYPRPDEVFLTKEQLKEAWAKERQEQDRAELDDVEEFDPEKHLQLFE